MSRNWRNKYLFDVEGEISHVLHNDSAEIQFILNGKTEKALLKQSRFYHCGRRIPDNASLATYIRNNMQVIFSCHILEQGGGPQNPYHNVQYNWFVIMCRASNRDPLTEVTITSGIFAAVGVIKSMTKRHGILSMTDANDDEHKVSFLASKVYIHGKRFPASKMLNTQLCLDERVVFDCVPCIPEEEVDNCRWFATCVFQGKRPRFDNFDINNPELHANYAVQKPYCGGLNKDGSTNGSLHQLQQLNNLKHKLLTTIKMHTSHARTLFTTGYGFIFDILNDEFGIILGCFKKNVYQTILFHRKNAFLFKVSLAKAKLNEIFMEGDRMKFIAVGAPANFFTDWIAVQVSVPTSVYRAEEAVTM